jgi:hypothetical protein
MSRLALRLAKLEAALTPPPSRWPATIYVSIGETFTEAFNRHVTEHGPMPLLLKGRLLAVPAIPITDEEKIAARKRTEIRQAALMEFVRRPRQPKEPTT